MINLLSSFIDIISIGENPYNLNFIGKFIQILIEGMPNIGLGIIVFTLILKAITLPLDIYSRVSMKKNNLKMERMRPQLEKLQRQYANDKALYNQKIQALYKKEGYSALSSCLPTLVTLVVFIIVINQFSNYSNYANLTLIEGMINDYNTAVATYNETVGEEVLVLKDGKYYVNQALIFGSDRLNEMGVSETGDEAHPYKTVDTEKFFNYLSVLNQNGYTERKVGVDIALNTETNQYVFTRDGFAPYDSSNPSTKTDEEVNAIITCEIMDYLSESKIEDVKKVAREASANYYRNNVPSFLWVKNIWAEDLFWKHPVKPTFSEYKFAVRKGCRSESANIPLSEGDYAEITYNLGAEKNAPNGYLILVILSIGIMIVSQVVMNKMQKAQMELQSVDQSAAQTTKMMTWMMPVMFGVFAFIYTASFSIYMVVSSAVSTLSTVIINKVVEKSFNKKLAEENKDKRFTANKKSK